LSTVSTSGGKTRALIRWEPARELQTIQVELEDNVLTISGERKAEHEDRKEGCCRVERAVGAFSRSLTLPEGIDPERIEAQFENGCSR
jgi:HSP20 family protein